MTDWDQFKLNPVRNGNNKSLDGGKYIGLGTHEAIIDGVDLGAYEGGGIYVELTFSNDDGQTINDRLSPMYDGEYSRKFNSLAWGLCGNDGVLRFEYFLSKQSFLADNPKGWGALVGCGVQIVVAKEKKGVVLEDNNGTFTLVDVATSEPCAMPDGSDNSFGSYKDAATACRNNKIKRAYDKVSYFEGSAKDEVVAANQTALKSLLAE